MNHKTRTNIMDKLAAKPGLVLKIQRVFNNFDGRCRQMAMSNPGRPMTDYCTRCQNKIKKALGDEVEL